MTAPRRGRREVVTAERLRDCAARGLSQSEAAQELGVLPSAVCHAQRRHGVALPAGRRGRPRIARACVIEAALKEGVKGVDIAAVLGITPQAVSHIKRRQVSQ